MTNSVVSMPPSPALYHAMLSDQQEAIVAQMAHACMERIGFYQALPEDTVRALVAGAFAIFMEALGAQDLALVRQKMGQRLFERLDQGATIDEVIQIPGVIRRVLFEHSIPALIEQVEGASAGLQFLIEACDQLQIAITHTYHARLDAANSELRRFKALADSVIDGIAVLDIKGRIVYANPAFQELLGYGDQTVGMAMSDLQLASNIEYVQTVVMPRLLEDGAWRGLVDHVHADGMPIPIHLSAATISRADGSPEALVAVFRDVRGQKAAEAERVKLQAEIIRIQEAALRELSTPLIPISDEIVIMPLIGAMDSRRAQQVLDTLLKGIAQTRARVAILDITGVSVVDTQVANALIGVARAVRLLGAEMILTGIGPEVAQTLVGLGVELRGIITSGSLQRGIAYALRRN